MSWEEKAYDILDYVEERQPGYTKAKNMAEELPYSSKEIGVVMDRLQEVYVSVAGADEDDPLVWGSKAKEATWQTGRLLDQDGRVDTDLRQSLTSGN